MRSRLDMCYRLQVGINGEVVKRNTIEVKKKFLIKSRGDGNANYDNVIILRIEGEGKE